MLSIRRLTAAFTTVLLLQLTLLGSGTLCALQGGTAPDTMAGMTGMHSASHAAAAPSQSPSHHPAAPQQCDESRQGGGCQQPWAPGQCASMTTCAAVTAPAGEIVAQVTIAAPAPDLPEPASIRSGPTATPELPPPRA